MPFGAYVNYCVPFSRIIVCLLCEAVSFQVAAAFMDKKFESQVLIRRVSGQVGVYVLALVDKSDPSS